MAPMRSFLPLPTDHLVNLCSNRQFPVRLTLCSDSDFLAGYVRLMGMMGMMGIKPLCASIAITLFPKEAATLVKRPTFAPKSTEMSSPRIFEPRNGEVHPPRQ
jgi:hypothetical protein